jgi:uncharacterized protein YdhG (YjbR/CyaY superfamily)
MSKPATVEEYLASIPPEAKPTLEDLRRIVVDTVPGAQEAISYGIPTVKSQGKAIVSISASKKHAALHLMSPNLADSLGEQIAEYRTSAATVGFPFGGPLPENLIRQIVRLRMEEISGNAAK